MPTIDDNLEILQLRPMVKDEAIMFYKLATRSNGAKFWVEKKIQTFNGFMKDWKGYFDGRKPNTGRCFCIVVNGNVIGEINYNDIVSGTTEIDIIIGHKKNMSKGYGPKAISKMFDILKEKGLKTVWLAVNKTNHRAIAAYKKAGFNKTIELPAYAAEDPYWKKQRLNDHHFLEHDLR